MIWVPVTVLCAFLAGIFAGILIITERRVTR
jgi:hypothetical protein